MNLMVQIIPMSHLACKLRSIVNRVVRIGTFDPSLNPKGFLSSLLTCCVLSVLCIAVVDPGGGGGGGGGGG